MSQFFNGKEERVLLVSCYVSQWSNARVRKSRYWGEMLLPPNCCGVTKPPYLLSGELCTSPLHSDRLFVYTVCCRRGGQCFSVFRTRHTDAVGDSSGRSYVTDQWHNVPLLRTRGLMVKTPMRKTRDLRFKSQLRHNFCVSIFIIYMNIDIQHFQY